MTPLTTPFGFSSTAADVLADVDLAGRRAIVTGATSGIGVETARALAAAGATVILGVRRLDAGRQIAAQLTASTGNDAVIPAVLDVANAKSVRDFADRFATEPIHMLINNAGIMALPELTRTPEGRELQFATNYLGHFALTLRLYPALKSARGARVVSVSSSGHLLSPVVFDDLDYRFRPYDPWTAYGQSKTADVLFAVGAAERWADDGITANALMPGNIADTSLARHMDMQQVADFIASGELALPPQKTVQQGAATSVLLAASPTVDGITGRYFEDCAQAEPVTERAGAVAGVAPYALDRENADRLWAVSESLV